MHIRKLKWNDGKLAGLHPIYKMYVCFEFNLKTKSHGRKYNN